MKYLIQTVETYRVDKEDEAKRMIEEAKSDNHFILKKYSSEYKEKKQKGEVIDTYYKVKYKISQKVVFFNIKANYM